MPTKGPRDDNELIDLIHQKCVDAKSYGLLAEVVYWAMMFAQKRPDDCLAQIIADAHAEWVK